MARWLRQLPPDYIMEIIREEQKVDTRRTKNHFLIPKDAKLEGK